MSCEVAAVTMRPDRAPSRTRVLSSGIAAALVAFALAGASHAGRPPLTAALIVVQVLTVLAWLAALGTRGGIGATAIAVAAAVAGDLLLATQDGAAVSRLAPVMGVALVVSLLHQLARRPRDEVTGSVAGTVSAVMLVAASAALIGLRGGPGGREAVAVALLGAGGALLAARLVDLVLARPAVIRGGTRGWLGLAVGVAVAIGLGAAYAADTDTVTAPKAVALAAVTGVLALVGDIAADAARLELSDADPRRRSAVVPLTVLLPFALVGPAAYVAGRVLLG